MKPLAGKCPSRGNSVVHWAGMGTLHCTFAWMWCCQQRTAGRVAGLGELSVCMRGLHVLHTRAPQGTGMPALGPHLTPLVGACPIRTQAWRTRTPACTVSSFACSSMHVPFPCPTCMPTSMRHRGRLRGAASRPLLQVRCVSVSALRRRHRGTLACVGMRHDWQCGPWVCGEGAVRRLRQHRTPCMHAAPPARHATV